MSGLTSKAFAASAVLVTGALAVGCAGSSDPAALAALPAGGTAADPPPPGAPPPPPPDADALDADVLAALARANVGPVALRPVESPELIELGRALFFDKLLSGNRNMACATCHDPAAGTGDALPLSLGEGATGRAAARTPTADDQVVARNAPGLFHVGAAGPEVMFWDGRVRRDRETGAWITPVAALNGPDPARPDLVEPLTSALAVQALFPVTSATEMRGDPGTNELADAADELEVWDLLMARLVGTADGTVGGVAAYRDLFRAAYPDAATFDALTFSHAARALAAFEAATWARFDSPFDRYLAGDRTALTADQKRGALLFAGRAQCVRCHGGPLLSDFRPHALAVPQLGPGVGGEPDDRGVAVISGDRQDDYRFRTPPLRNVALTGPFFHDGAMRDLRAVLRHYRDPGQSLLDYDPAAQLPPLFRARVDADPVRNQARIAQIDPVIGPGIPISRQDEDLLIAFLNALTDPAAATPVPAPTSVPSGLPVGD